MVSHCGKAYLHFAKLMIPLELCDCDFHGECGIQQVQPRASVVGVHMSRKKTLCTCVGDINQIPSVGQSRK